MKVFGGLVRIMTPMWIYIGDRFFAEGCGLSFLSHGLHWLPFSLPIQTQVELAIHAPCRADRENRQGGTSTSESVSNFFVKEKLVERLADFLRGDEDVQQVERCRASKIFVLH